MNTKITLKIIQMNAKKKNENPIVHQFLFFNFFVYESVPLYSSITLHFQIYFLTNHQTNKQTNFILNQIVQKLN